MTRPPLHELARRRVVIFDGGMGTALMARKLPLSDYLDKENCSEAVNLTRPDVIADIHRGFFEVGCDAVETNTFGANEVVLGEFGLEKQTREINRIATEIARKVAAEFRVTSSARWGRERGCRRSATRPSRSSRRATTSRRSASSTAASTRC
jgi:5-methyltetrahydrofolate--homocysteine methyltransferase